MSDLQNQNETRPSNLPNWILFWIAALVTFVVVGTSLGLFVPDFKQMAEYIILGGVTILTGVFIKR